MTVPSWAIGAAGGVLLLGGSHWLAYSTGVDHEATRQRLAIAGTSNAALVVARSIETAQAVTTVEAVQRAQSDISALPDVRPELDRLRNSNAELRGQLSRAAADAERGQAATGAAMVLSDMLRRAEKRIADLEPIAARAVELAEAYDRGRVSGNLCTELSDAWRTAQIGAANAP